MKILLLFVVLTVLTVDAFGDKPRKLKKVRRHRTTTSTTTESEVSASEEEKDIFSMLESDEAALEKEKEKLELALEKDEKVITEQKDDLTSVENNDILQDPCLKKRCSAGQVCDINDDGQAECVCIPSCPEESDPRRKVCSNLNETWGSDCEVYQMRCLCNHGLEGCKGEKYKHVHIDYYGVCRDMPECTADEKSDFPRRMRDWLFNIMRDLADRQELSPHYLEMEREAETNLTRRWANAAVWKWCDLDGHPHDRSVSRHELFPIRAPLMALEHCIAPFLSSCDEDDDHMISLREWGKCLEINMDDLEEKCDELLEG